MHKPASNGRRQKKLTAKQEKSLATDKRPLKVLSQIYGVSQAYISILRNPAPVHEVDAFTRDLIFRSSRSIKSLADHYNLPELWIRQIKRPPLNPPDPNRIYKRRLTDADRAAIRADTRSQDVIADSWLLSQSQVSRIQNSKPKPPKARGKGSKRLSEETIRAIIADPRPAHIVADEYNIMPSRVHQLRGE